MTAAAYLMGIDIGTYSSKGVLVAVDRWRGTVPSWPAM